MEPSPLSSEAVSTTCEGSNLDSSHGLSSASTIGVLPGGGSQISTGSDAEKPCSLTGSTEPESLVSDDKSQSGIILPSSSLMCVSKGTTVTRHAVKPDAHEHRLVLLVGDLKP